MQFSSIWPPKMDPKFDIFDNFFENADFAKIIVFPKENCYFSCFEPPKFNQKSMQKRYQKNLEKKELENRILASMLAPKTSKIDPKSDAGRSSLRDAMEIARASAETNGRHRL